MDQESKPVLTPEEQSAVDKFIAAAQALPESICVDVDDYDDDWDEPNLIVRKRISPGYAVEVAELKKPSLSF